MERKLFCTNTVCFEHTILSALCPGVYLYGNIPSIIGKKLGTTGNEVRADYDTGMLKDEINKYTTRNTTNTHIYIYMCVCVCVCVCKFQDGVAKYIGYQQANQHI